MLSYVVAVIAVLLVFSNPIRQVLWPSNSLSRRTERPQLNESLIALEGVNDDNNNEPCPPDAYRIHIFSKEPLVLYIENFLSQDDISHLLELSEPIFEPSTTTNDGSSAQHNPSVRLSEVALLPRTPPVRCIESRARALQGWRHDLWIERLRTQRYVEGGHYRHHFDWGAGAGGWGRVSSFMVWVAAQGGDHEGLVGGGTEFPYLRRGSDDERWCEFVECYPGKGEEGEGKGDDDEALGSTQGTVFKPVPRNAVFWENFRADGSGRGYQETFHAGLPVERGVKVGLNIWSWGRID